MAKRRKNPAPRQVPLETSLEHVRNARFVLELRFPPTILPCDDPDDLEAIRGAARRVRWARAALIPVVDDAAAAELDVAAWAIGVLEQAARLGQSLVGVEAVDVAVSRLTEAETALQPGGRP